MTLATKPEVFIVESLNFRDEQLERYEGQIISKILALSGKQCHYYYIRTQRELEVVLTKFTKSTYRYLHFSCHGNNKNIYTTLDEIPFARFGALLMPHLREKRLFVSACSVANNRLAKNVLLGSGCYSLLGPAQDIAFGDAAVFWSSLYHIMFSENPNAMKRPILREKAQILANIFKVRLTYFGQEEMSKRGYSSSVIKPRTR